MSDATYGELLANAERYLVRAIFATHEPFRSAPAARDAVDGYADMLVALKEGVRTVAGVVTPGQTVVLPPPTSSAGGLFRTLDDASASFARSRESTTRGGEWNASARAMLAATTLLASHLGPDRAHRTPDAPMLDDIDAQRAGLHRLAVFALTSAEGGRHLALRVQDAAIRFPRPGQLRAAAKWLMTAQASLGEAAATVINADRAGPSQSALAMLRPAPLLAPTRDADPVAAARRSFDRIRLFAHRQARGEVDAGIDAVRAYATAGMHVAMHSHAITTAASKMHSTNATGKREELMPIARALLATRKPWADLLNAAERCTTTGYSPPLLGHEVACLSESLGMVTRDSGQWRPPAEILPTTQVEGRLLHLVHHLGSRLPDLAIAANAITKRLYERGELLVPTREREDLDLPYRWAPVSAERLADLREAGRAAKTATVSAAGTTELLVRPVISLQRQALASPSKATPIAAASRRSVRR